jgi:cytochrome c553
MIRTLTLVFVLASCGPRAAAPPPQPPPDATHEAGAWAKLSFEERHSVMTFTVLPNMARAWRDFRATKDPEMTCRTCHGADAEAVNYRMPNPSLVPIDPARVPPGPVAEFMKSTMVPDMCELLDSPNVTCNSCHTVPVK